MDARADRLRQPSGATRSVGLGARVTPSCVPTASVRRTIIGGYPGGSSRISRRKTSRGARGCPVDSRMVCDRGIFDGSCPPTGGSGRTRVASPLAEGYAGHRVRTRPGSANDEQAWLCGEPGTESRREARFRRSACRPSAGRGGRVRFATRALFRFRVRKLVQRLFSLFSGQKCYQVTSWCPDRKPKRSVCFMAAVVNVGCIGSTARSSDKRGEEPALLDVQPFRSALSRTTGAHEHEGSPQVCVRLRAPAQRNVIVIEKPEAPVADDDERDRIVWPDPSPLSGWWAEVMAHRRITRPHSSADPRHN